MLKAGLPAKIVAGLGNGGKVGQLNKGQLLAATTVLLNLAVLIAKQDAAAVTTLADVRNKSLRVLASILEAPACKASVVPPPTTSGFVNARTPMGCTDPLRKEVGSATIRVPLGSSASYLIHADVRTFR